MTQQEFHTRVQMEVSAEEFEAINVVYMHSDLGKDEFCALWVKMNQTRVSQAKSCRGGTGKARKALENRREVHERHI